MDFTVHQLILIFFVHNNIRNFPIVNYLVRDRITFCILLPNLQLPSIIVHCDCWNNRWTVRLYHAYIAVSMCSFLLEQLSVIDSRANVFGRVKRRANGYSVVGEQALSPLENWSTSNTSLFMGNFGSSAQHINWMTFIGRTAPCARAKARSWWTRLRQKEVLHSYLTEDCRTHVNTQVN